MGPYRVIQFNHCCTIRDQVGHRIRNAPNSNSFVITGTATRLNSPSWAFSTIIKPTLSLDPRPFKILVNKSNSSNNDNKDLHQTCLRHQYLLAHTGVSLPSGAAGFKGPNNVISSCYLQLCLALLSVSTDERESCQLEKFLPFFQ